MPGPFSRRPRRAVLIALALALALSASPTPAADDGSHGPGAAAKRIHIFPVEDLRRGMRGHGLTVIDGKTIERFGVKILGVQKDGIAPGIDFILVRTSGRVMRKTTGIAAGMSGSPVYIRGKLVGAIAFGFFGGDFRVGGVTPAKPMVQILDYPNEPLKRLPSTVHLTRTLRLRAEQAAGGSGEMRELALPLAVSGLGERAMDLLRLSIERADLPFLAVSGGSARPPRPGARTDPLPPGSSYSGVLSYGDLTIAGTGTTTARLGKKSLAFGHPFFFSGPVSLGLNGSKILAVIKDEIFGPFKFPVVGRPHGTLTQDRLAGVAGIEGVFPALTGVDADLANLDTGFRQVGTTRIAQEFEFLADLVFFALLSEADRAYDRIGPGGANFTWTVSGTRAAGRPFTFQRTNLFDSEFDISLESLFEVLGNVFSIQNNGFEPVELTGVRLHGSLTQKRRVQEIVEVSVTSSSTQEPVTQGTVFAQPGDTLTIDVVLKDLEGEFSSRTFEMVVPDDAFGSLELVVRGGAGGFFDEFFFDEPTNGTPDGEPGSFDDLLEQLASAPHNNDLIAELLFFDEQTGASETIERQIVTLEQVVRGERFFEVFVEGGEEEPPPEPGP